MSSRSCIRFVRSKTGASVKGKLNRVSMFWLATLVFAVTCIMKPSAGHAQLSEADALELMSRAYTGAAPELAADAVFNAEWWCASGVARACTFYGRYLELGYGTNENVVAAVQQFQIGCQLGDAWGCMNYGWNVYEGWGVASNHADGLALLAISCGMGSGQGCGLVADRLGNVSFTSPAELGRTPPGFQIVYESSWSLFVSELSDSGFRQARQFQERACAMGEAERCGSVPAGLAGEERGADSRTSGDRARSQFDDRSDEEFILQTFSALEDGLMAIPVSARTEVLFGFHLNEMGSGMSAGAQYAPGDDESGRRLRPFMGAMGGFSIGSPSRAGDRRIRLIPRFRRPEQAFGTVDSVAGVTWGGFRIGLRAGLSTEGGFYVLPSTSGTLTDVRAAGETSLLAEANHVLFARADTPANSIPVNFSLSFTTNVGRSVNEVYYREASFGRIINLSVIARSGYIRIGAPRPEQFEPATEYLRQVELDVLDQRPLTEADTRENGRLVEGGLRFTAHRAWMHPSLRIGADLTATAGASTLQGNSWTRFRVQFTPAVTFKRWITVAVAFSTTHSPSPETPFILLPGLGFAGSMLTAAASEFPNSQVTAIRGEIGVSFLRFFLEAGQSTGALPERSIRGWGFVLGPDVSRFGFAAFLPSLVIGSGDRGFTASARYTFRRWGPP